MKTKSRIFAGVMAAVAALVVGFTVVGFSGCGGAEINISGSTSISPLMEKLVAAYKESHDVTINITESGSSAGITDTQNGAVDFGMASRELKASETGVKATKIADDGIALIVHNDSEVTNVTADEVYALYAEGTPIRSSLTVAYGREAGSGTRGAFDELIENSAGDTLDKLESGYDAIVTQYSGTNQIKEAVAGNKAAIGYISMGSLDATVKAVSYEGVAATAANVVNKSYALSRPFNLVLPTAGLDADAQAFVDFILSAAGQAIVESEGYIKV